MKLLINTCLFLASVTLFLICHIPPLVTLFLSFSFYFLAHLVDSTSPSSRIFPPMLSHSVGISSCTSMEMTP